jgi:hypothetical protein
MEKAADLKTRGPRYPPSPMMSPLKSFLLAVLLAGVLSPRLWAGHRHITGTPENRIANQVLASLLSSLLGKTMPKLHYQVILLEDYSPNAMSQPNGKIYVTSGLLPIFEGDRGVWAAVIGHELGHVVLAHPRAESRFEAALRQAYAGARAQGYGQGAGNWPDVELGQGISKLKLSRAEEYQADFIGLMLMADGGYQPGFLVVMEKRLLFGLGSTPGMIAFFTRHPRLQSREENTLKSYKVAMDIFRSRWPDVEKSPGGRLPPYGAIGKWTFEQPDGGEHLVFNVPVEVHNAAGMKVRVAAFFLDGDLRVRSVDAQDRAADGSLVLNYFFSGAASQSLRVRLEVPARRLGPHHRKLLSVVFLMVGNRVLDGSFLHVEVARKLSAVSDQ